MIERTIIATAVAVGEYNDETLWRAFAHRKSGVLLVKDANDVMDGEDQRGGVCQHEAYTVPFPDEESTMFFVLSAAMRKRMGMSDAAYQELNVGLNLDYDAREAKAQP